MEKNDINLCDACKALLGKKRHTPPHKYLIQTNFLEVKSQFCNVDEYFYTCRTCSKTWLLEKGTYGQGWVYN
ncbi:hypothetical protein [Sphingobacterium sp. MYb388]|uniref:hypothetical protein n=1 Tax=Sphingobacterium sp. MYb388 TaxID=2745437 RepID=UPI0030A1C886